jgi:predicted ATPase
MITELRMQNFKSWKDTGTFKLGSLTGLFGANSSGKTSILQLLLLIKQTVESTDTSRVLHTGDETTYVDVGTFADIIYRHEIPNQLIFSLSWKPQNSLYASKTERVALRSLEIKAVNFTCTIFGSNEQVVLEKFAYNFKWEYRGDNLPRYGNSSVGLHRVEEGNAIKYEPFNESYNLQIPDTQGLDAFELQPIKSYGFPSAFMLSNNLLLTFVSDFEQNFRDMYYLGPLREYPRHIYLASGEKPKDVGRRGEQTILALLSEPSVTLAVGEALKKLGLIHSFALKPIAKGRKEHEVLVKIEPNSPEVPITDVGFGISQILPVLVLCYYVKEGSTLILEQPEIHLHPAVQAGLADIFIDVIKKRNIQIIVESHSEHLLRRLQRRIAEKQLSNDVIALYFCQRDIRGDSELVPLQLDRFGNISNWPENFFGDELGDVIARTEAEMVAQLEN